MHALRVEWFCPLAASAAAPGCLLLQRAMAPPVPAACRPTCACEGSTIVLGASQDRAGASLRPRARTGDRTDPHVLPAPPVRQATPIGLPPWRSCGRVPAKGCRCGLHGTRPSRARPPQSSARHPGAPSHPGARKHRGGAVCKVRGRRLARAPGSRVSRNPFPTSLGKPYAHTPIPASRLVAPRPCHMLDSKHNRGVRPSCTHAWDFYANLTVAGTDNPLLVGNEPPSGPQRMARIVAPNVSHGLRLASVALASGWCFRWELLPRRREAESLVDGARWLADRATADARAAPRGHLTAPDVTRTEAAEAEADAMAANPLEFHWFRGKNMWQRESRVRSIRLPWGNDHAQRGEAYTVAGVRAEPSRDVLRLAQRVEEALGHRPHASVHVRRGDVAPESRAYLEFKARAGGLSDESRWLGELTTCDTSPGAVGHALADAALIDNRHAQDLFFFTDETNPEYLSALRSALEAANVSDRVLDGDAFLREHASFVHDVDNFFIYATSLVIRTRAEWEWRWDRQECYGARVDPKTDLIRDDQMRGGAVGVSAGWSRGVLAPTL